MQLANSSPVPVFLISACLLLGAAAAASAQQPTAPQPIDPGEDGWVSAAGGATFGSQTQRAAVFAGEYGDDVTRNVQAYVTVSYFDNLMRQDLTDDLSLLSAALTATTGTTWDLHGRDRGVTLIVGGRYLFASQGLVRPYVGGGGGIINLKRTIADGRVGNVTSAVLNQFGVGDLSITTQTLTRPLLEGAVGVGFFGGPVYVDVGYRYKRAFHLNETFDFSQAVVGIGYRF